MKLLFWRKSVRARENVKRTNIVTLILSNKGPRYFCEVLYIQQECRSSRVAVYVDVDIPK